MDDRVNDELLQKTGSLYKLCVLAARRALELNSGAPKLVQTQSTRTGSIALEEIRDGMITFKAKEPKKNEE